MRGTKKYITWLSILLLGSCFFGVAGATPVTMHFDHLNPHGERVANYYDGGCALTFFYSTGTCGGPDYGVDWSGAALAHQGGLFSNPPSGPNFIQRVGIQPMVMNVADGFGSGFSFYYSSAIYPARVTLYNGLNGSGTVLATTGNLPHTPFFCSGGIGTGGCWSHVDHLDFSGLVHSVVFDTPILGAVFDDISFNVNTPATPVPEPGELAMFGLGMLLIGLFAGLRRRFG